MSLVAVARTSGLMIHEVPGAAALSAHELILQRVRCPSAVVTSWWAWLAGNADDDINGGDQS